MYIELKNVNKTYVNGEIKTEALKEVNLRIDSGEFVVVLGPSGSGKSTLLNVLSGLDTASSGNITINHQYITGLKEKELTEFRRNNLGFIFQQYNLLSTLTVRENVELGYHIGKDPFDMDELLQKVGLEDQKDKYPHQMSGGQQQRVSIARALVKNPFVLFCDEPTGALDETTGKGILKLLKELNETFKTTVILITHNPAIGQIADRIIKMNSGEIVLDQRNDSKVDALEISWS